MRGAGLCVALAFAVMPVLAKGRWAKSASPPPPPPPEFPMLLVITITAIVLIFTAVDLLMLRRKTPQPTPRERGTIRTPDGYTIDINIFNPEVPTAAAVFAHGGCFHDGDYTTHPAVSEALASIGVASVSSSYRQGASYPHPMAQRDLAVVAEFVRKRWPDLPFGIVGSSSGGWHALMLSRSLPDVRFCIALCPVAHPLRRATYLKACIEGQAAASGYAVLHPPATAKAMLEKQTGYWGSEDAMAAAGEALLSAPTQRVPTMMVLGSHDKNVPQNVTAGVQGWADRTLVLGGCGHEIQDTPPARNSWVPDVKHFVEDNVLSAAAQQRHVASATLPRRWKRAPIAKE